MKNFKMKFLGLAVIYVSFCGAMNADQPVTYINQRGSTLTLTMGDNNTVTGTFTSAVGTCAVGKAMPVTGSLNGNALAISVDLKECKKVIGMTGNFTEGNKELRTLWLVAAHSDDPHKSDWNTNIVGTDHYKKQG